LREYRAWKKKIARSWCRKRAGGQKYCSRDASAQPHKALVFLQKQNARGEGDA